MADKEANVMTLPADVRARLEKSAPDLERARNAINTIKKLGIDVSDLEEKIKWAETVRTTLLTEFK